MDAPRAWGPREGVDGVDHFADGGVGQAGFAVDHAEGPDVALGQDVSRFVELIDAPEVSLAEAQFDIREGGGFRIGWLDGSARDGRLVGVDIDIVAGDVFRAPFPRQVGFDVQQFCFVDGFRVKGGGVSEVVSHAEVVHGVVVQCDGVDRATEPVARPGIGHVPAAAPVGPDEEMLAGIFFHIVASLAIFGGGHKGARTIRPAALRVEPVAPVIRAVIDRHQAVVVSRAGFEVCDFEDDVSFGHPVESLLFFPGPMTLLEPFVVIDVVDEKAHRRLAFFGKELGVDFCGCRGDFCDRLADDFGVILVRAGELAIDIDVEFAIMPAGVDVGDMFPFRGGFDVLRGGLPHARDGRALAGVGKFRAEVAPESVPAQQGRHPFAPEGFGVIDPG